MWAGVKTKRRRETDVVVVCSDANKEWERECGFFQVAINLNPFIQKTKATHGWEICK
jgi:hypothetical protein